MFSVSAMAAQTKQPNGGYLPVSLYKSKRVNSSYGSMDIDVPQDRNAVMSTPYFLAFLKERHAIGVCSFTKSFGENGNV